MLSMALSAGPMLKRKLERSDPIFLHIRMTILNHQRLTFFSKYSKKIYAFLASNPHSWAKNKGGRKILRPAEHRNKI
jgi:hypothetical protein